MKDYYDILDLPTNAEPEKIRKQYRLLVIACHPDKFTDPAEKDEAEEKLKDINEAYEILRDPHKRARYDRRRKTPTARRTSRPSYDPEPSTRAPRNYPNQPPDHLHYEFHALRGDNLEVRVNRRANVILLDEANYRRYRLDQPFRYVGGYVHISPVQLSVPYSGIWHLVIDQGGLSGAVQATARIRRYW